jgi:hypothetical protein
MLTQSAEVRDVTRYTLRKVALVSAAAVLTAVTAAIALPVLAEVPFTREKSAVARHADRYGDLSLGAVIRTDERYNQAEQANGT